MLLVRMEKTSVTTEKRCGVLQLTNILIQKLDRWLIQKFCVLLHIQFAKFFFIFVYSGQEQQDRNYAASIQYQCGDKCFVSFCWGQTNKQTSKIVAPLKLDFFKMTGCNKVTVF